MQAVFLDYASVSYGDLDASRLVEALPELCFCDATAPDQIVDRIQGAEFVLVNALRLTREHLTAARCLRFVALAATGTDKVDLATARERGIAVCNVVGYCTASVAQHAWSLILALTQRLVELRRFSVEGRWAAGEEFGAAVQPIRELAGRTLGIVGWGELGRAVATIGEAFGMRVVIANRPGGAPQASRLDLHELLRVADVVSLHCPLTEATRGMIGADELALMKPDALLINTARGGLIDAEALRRALAAGQLGGAGIDVLAQEPPVDGHPLVDAAIPNLIVTPHVAWAAREARQRCIDEMAANVREFQRGGRRMRVD